MTINKVSKEFKDGVADAMVYGIRNEETHYLTSHDYKYGYDFGIAIWHQQQENDNAIEENIK